MKTIFLLLSVFAKQMLFWATMIQTSIQSNSYPMLETVSIRWALHCHRRVPLYRVAWKKVPAQAVFKLTILGFVPSIFQHQWWYGNFALLDHDASWMSFQPKGLIIIVYLYSVYIFCTFIFISLVFKKNL